MQTIILTVGLPRSGKSTWALKQGYPIVNRDAIRLAHHGEAFLGKCEDFITYLENLMVDTLLETGHKFVIIDATHITKKRRDKWVNRYKGKDVNIIYKPFTTSVELCRERAMTSDKAYLLDVIDRMTSQLETLTKDEVEANITFNTFTDF